MNIYPLLLLNGCKSVLSSSKPFLVLPTVKEVAMNTGTQIEPKDLCGQALFYGLYSTDDQWCKIMANTEGFPKAEGHEAWLCVHTLG